MTYDSSQLDRIAEEFEQAWQQGQSVKLGVWLQRVKPELKSKLAERLVPVEIQFRRQRGDQIDPVSDYHDLGPALVELIQQFLADYDQNALAGGHSNPDSDAEPASDLDSPKPRDDLATIDPKPADLNYSKRSPVIGNYKLLQKLGEGGMGEVWMAEQERPVRRRVALKLIKAGLGYKQVIARFEAERQVLAMMDHQNIAKVLDAGTTESGQPYFVMELVQGIPFTQFCDQNKLSIDERLQLFIPVCNAVQHAHQKGIIHRDLKPTNVLVSLYDGQPVPKVIDFGLAKALQHTTRLTDKTLFTEFGQVVGTLQYMSPEQAEMNQLDIDTRTDIYSLGIMLYELLTGSTPIEADTLRNNAILQVLATIRETDPPRPSVRLSSNTNEAVTGISTQRNIDPAKLKTLLRGDLDWIVMRAMEKDRTRRYETANGLAVEIQRFLSGDPVRARPPSRAYLLRKYVRKHKGLVASLGAIAALLLLATIGTSYGMYQAGQNASRAEDREQRAIDAVKRFRDAVAKNPELKQNPALESLRRTLLKEPLAFFRDLRDQLQADGNTNPESLKRLAEASFELGAMSEEIGNMEDALTAYKSSLTIRQRLATEAPHDWENIEKLAQHHHNVGYVLARTGRPDDALQSYDAAVALHKDLIEQFPMELCFQAALAKAHLNKGVFFGERGNPNDAQHCLNLALTQWQQLSKVDPDPQYRKDIALTLNNLTKIFFQNGQVDKARAAIDQALAIQQKLAEDHPNDEQLQQDLAISHHTLGYSLSQAGNPREALSPFQAAIAIQNKLLKSQPAKSVYQADLARSLVNLGLASANTGDSYGASQSYQSAAELHRKLADANPTVTQYRQELSWSYNNIGALFAQNGKLEEAIEAMNDALDVTSDLAASNPQSPEYQSELATSHFNIGAILGLQKKFDEAITSSLKALAIRKRLADEHPERTDYQYGVARNHLNLGELYISSKKEAEAKEMAQMALGILESLARAQPDNPRYVSDMGIATGTLASIELEANRLEPARELFKESIVLLKKALESAPENPVFQNSLDEILTRLADVERRLGNDSGTDAKNELKKGPK